MAFFRFLGKILLFPVWLALLCVQLPLMFATCLGGGIWRTCVVILGIFDLISTLFGPQPFWIFLITLPLLVLMWFVPTLLDVVAGLAKGARELISLYWHTPCTTRLTAGPYERARKSKAPRNVPNSEDTRNALEATRLMKEREQKQAQQPVPENVRILFERVCEDHNLVVH